MSFVFSKKAITTIIIVVVIGIVFFISTFLYKHFFPKLIPIAPVEQKGNDQKYKIIGYSVEGRKIESYTYGTGENHIVFVGGIHGGYEWNSVFLAYRFINYFNANQTVIPSNLTVTIIPSANPDGVYKLIGKEGEFTVADLPENESQASLARFNANKVDLNRNFDCKWKATSTWKGNVVSAGTSAFSEPEAKAIKNFVLENNPKAVIFWHSQSNAVYASECKNGILPETINVMNAYAKASGYPAVNSFSSYEITGDAEGWLASINIPAITVELKTHETIEWDKNIAGVKALFDYYK
ncbi:MAG: M14 family zinc carboxypeptidase [Candidatus Pacebacteria bacterium]|nr:M14 family zinc carboxypeptidase [Candidatus Paceibacterota bacterium]